MTDFLLILITLLVAINGLLILFKKPKTNVAESILAFKTTLNDVEKSIKDDFQRNRDEFNTISSQNRAELTQSLAGFSQNFSAEISALNALLRQQFKDFSTQQTASNQQTTEHIKDIRGTVETQLKNIRDDNTRQLDEMRKTVDEKLQKTLNERLSQSFETVNKQLKSVQEGLGEMKNLAEDVGGLKKVLSNVKMRGSLGETQLEMLLEQILSPDQYSANVQPNPNTSESVEFAIKLPGKDGINSPIWLPIDAKFPKDKYQHLVDAYEDGDPVLVEKAKKSMENTIKKMAKDISEKYLNPPNTTDFGIMFLPFEGIYAEVVRNVSLLETLQRQHKVIVTGPTTLAAILNSLQMGFKTLAIEKRSSEVWQVLGAVKKEFENFGGIMTKAQKNIQIGLGQLDDVMGKRTRAIVRKLREVESLTEAESRDLLTDLDQSPRLNDDKKS